MFTVIFKGDPYNLSFNLVFEPCPIWLNPGTNDWEINLNPENPHYQLGSVRKLFDHMDIEPKLHYDRACIVIVEKRHQMFSDSYLDILVKDLANEKFKVKVSEFN